MTPHSTKVSARSVLGLPGKTTPPVKRSSDPVARRLAQVPVACRKTYLRAMTGKSRPAGVKAMCQQCLGWSDYEQGIRNCTDPACPLHPYRPYKVSIGQAQPDRCRVPSPLKGKTRSRKRVPLYGTTEFYAPTEPLVKRKNPEWLKHVQEA